MKLLPKSVVNTELASQKKKQIDEGLMIARKVDALRVTLASLEQQHKNFIDGMQSELKVQTKPLINEVADLKSEIERLESKRKELLVPLTKEWNEVNEKRKSLDVISENLLKEQVILRKDKEVLEARLKKEKENVVKINTIRNEIAKVLKKAEDNEIETSKTLRTVQLAKEKTFKDIEERTQAIKERDAEVAVKEREVNLQKESNDREAKFIKEEKIRLLDQRATLERAMLRIKK